MHEKHLKILRALSDGEPKSGPAIAAATGLHDGGSLGQMLLGLSDAGYLEILDRPIVGGISTILVKITAKGLQQIR